MKKKTFKEFLAENPNFWEDVNLNLFTNTPTPTPKPSEYIDNKIAHSGDALAIHDAFMCGTTYTKEEIINKLKLNDTTQKIFFEGGIFLNYADSFGGDYELVATYLNEDKSALYFYTWGSDSYTCFGFFAISENNYSVESITTIDLYEDISKKQDKLVSGTNIKTINNQSLLGSGNIVVNKSSVGLGNVNNTSDANKPISTATQEALNTKQDTLVSGTNIKTINGYSLLGSGNIDIESGGGTSINIVELGQLQESGGTLTHELTNQIFTLAGTPVMFIGVFEAKKFTTSNIVLNSSTTLNILLFAYGSSIVTMQLTKSNGAYTITTTTNN